MNSTIIAPVSIRHIPALNRLFKVAVEQHFSYFPEAARLRVVYDHRSSKLLRAAIHPRRIILVARFNNQLVGYAIGGVPKNGHGQLFWLYVDPARRGNNTGLALLSRMIKLQRELGAIDVSLATYDHRRYYERQGFVFRGVEQSYGVPVDIMTFGLK